MTLWMLVGCGSLGLDPLAAGDDTEASPVSISDVDPSFGPTSGGNVVTVSGEGFEGTVTVRFGDAEVTASKIDSGTIAVTAPDAGVEATVDLTVVSDLGSATRASGYRFGDEPPDTGDDGGADGGDGGDDGGDDGGSESGVAGLIEFSLLQIACPDCFSLTSELDVSAQVAFHTPLSGSWVGWIPASGSCVTNPSTAPPTSSYLDAGGYVHLQSGSHSIGLVKTSGADGPTYLASGLSNDDYARTAFYALDIDGGTEVGTELVDNAMLTPQGFSSVTPTEALYTDSRSAFAARISRAGQSFTWAPYGGTGLFLVMLEAYDGRTGTYIGTGLCAGPDNGGMNVPSSVTGAFPSGSLLAIYFLRYQIEYPTLASGATLESVARVGVLGTGIIQ